MARKSKPVQPTEQIHKLSFQLEGWIVAQVDEAAKQIAESDPYRRPMTRTDALRALILEGLQAREARLKKKPA